MKIGDKLKFNKFNWVIVDEINHISGVKEYKYRVFRKYFNRLIPLSNTKASYTIFSWRWEFLKNELKKNPKYHYNMHLWSGYPRR